MKIAEVSDIKPNPLALKVGDVVLMEGEKTIEVTIDKISHTGFSANVTEKKSGKKWLVSINCLHEVIL